MSRINKEAIMSFRQSDQRSAEKSKTKMKLTKYVPATVLTAFGLLTMFLTSTILLDLFGMREKNAGYTPFVIWVNFFCGIAYITAAYGFLKSKKWTAFLLGLAVLALLITFFTFNNFIANGGIHKADTYGALIFRLSITTLFALVAKFTINNKTN